MRSVASEIKYSLLRWKYSIFHSSLIRFFRFEFSTSRRKPKQFLLFFFLFFWFEKCFCNRRFFVSQFHCYYFLLQIYVSAYIRFSMVSSLSFQWKIIFYNISDFRHFCLTLIWLHFYFNLPLHSCLISFHFSSYLLFHLFVWFSFFRYLWYEIPIFSIPWLIYNLILNVQWRKIWKHSPRKKN